MAMLALADIADDDGHVVFARGRSRSQEALAAKARMSVATWRRVTEALVSDGLLEVSRASQTSENEYRILVTAQPERSDLSGQNGDFERSHRSPMSGHTSYIHSYVNTDVSEVADAPLRDDVVALLDLLDEEIIRNGGKAPARSKKNIDAARLLLDRDGKTVEQVSAAIRWCQADEFWRSNILSMSKLRQQYDRLRLQASRSRRMSGLDLGRAADALLAEEETRALEVAS
ncbi:hypothetical protein ACQUSW_03695 [Microbacterium sp. YY-01]